VDLIRVGQNHVYTVWCVYNFLGSFIHTPYMTVYLVIFLTKIPHINRIYMANPIHAPLTTVDPELIRTKLFR